MALTFTYTATLADGNQFRLRDDASGFVLLAVKLGANPIQEVALTAAEADKVIRILQMLNVAKVKDIQP